VGNFVFCEGKFFLKSDSMGEFKNGDSVTIAGVISALILMPNQLFISVDAMDHEWGHIEVLKWIFLFQFSYGHLLLSV
jgi:hypothetical protein